MNREQFEARVAKTIPGAEVNQDREGQIVIYTGLVAADDYAEQLARMKKIAPGLAEDADLDGQLLIYTGLIVNEDGQLVPLSTDASAP